MTGARSESRSQEALQPRPGEQRSSVLATREVSSDYQRILYVVHPSTGGKDKDGDTGNVAKNAIQQRVSQTPSDTRIITIVPPNDSVYLEPGTPTTDIRKDAEEYRWVKSEDITPEVRRVTLVGGNLERCLGSVAEDIRGKALHPLIIELPLDAIYTTHDISANDMLRHMVTLGASPTEAITALLTTTQPLKTYGSYGFAGETEILPSSARLNPFRLQLNGQEVAILVPITEPELELPESNPSSGITWIPAPPKEPLPEITLSVEANLREGIHDTSISADLRDMLVAKIDHAREVLRRYQQPEIAQNKQSPTTADQPLGVDKEQEKTPQKSQKRGKQIQEILKKIFLWRQRRNKKK